MGLPPPQTLRQMSRQMPESAAPYRIEIKPTAAKALGRLSRPDAVRIARKIDELALAPRPHGSIKLSGEDLYRIRVGDYRVLYSIEDTVLIVLVVSIGHRREVYR